MVPTVSKTDDGSSDQMTSQALIESDFPSCSVRNIQVYKMGADLKARKPERQRDTGSIAATKWRYSSGSKSGPWRAERTEQKGTTFSKKNVRSDIYSGRISLFIYFFLALLDCAFSLLFVFGHFELVLLLFNALQTGFGLVSSKVFLNIEFYAE